MKSHLPIFFLMDLPCGIISKKSLLTGGQVYLLPHFLLAVHFPRSSR